MFCKHFIFNVTVLVISFHSTALTLSYKWAVVGAGLAGVTTLSVLIEKGQDPKTIVWIDPEFNVGRMGKYYRNVPANTKNQILHYYFNRFSVFKNVCSPNYKNLLTADPNAYPLLSLPQMHWVI